MIVSEARTISESNPVPSEFEEARRLREEDPNRVRCAHCGAWIFSRATKCPKCGTHFLGEAFQFTHESDDLNAERQRRRRRSLVFGAVLLLLFLIGTVLYYLGTRA